MAHGKCVINILHTRNVCFVIHYVKLEIYEVELQNNYDTYIYMIVAKFNAYQTTYGTFCDSKKIQVIVCMFIYTYGCKPRQARESCNARKDTWWLGIMLSRSVRRE